MTSARSTSSGYLKITDRKKDFFKTSGGKYVAPSLIESTFKGLCPYVSQFMVYGADHNFVTALVTLDPDAIKEWADTARRHRRLPRDRHVAARRATWCRCTSTTST